MDKATVLGANGFIGSALVARLRKDRAAVATVERGEPVPREPGHVYFCAGVTADFRTRLHDTVEAHVTLLSEVLRMTEFTSLTYLSSTRVYARASSGDEDAVLPVDPRDPSEVYNLSKLMGEALCLADPRPSARVARLSNVIGKGDSSPGFLNALVREARESGTAVIRDGPAGAKDYVALEDAVEALARIPHRARSRLVNIASGRRTSNREIAGLVEEHLGARVRFEAGGGGILFPQISIERMKKELEIDPEPTSQAFARLFGVENV